MSVTTAELKLGLNDLIASKEDALENTLKNNDATLRELHYLLTGGNDDEDAERVPESAGAVEIQMPDAFKRAKGDDTWAKRFSLRQAKREPIAEVAIPTLSASPQSLPTILPSDLPEASSTATATLPSATPTRAALSRSTTPASRATSPRNPHRTRLSTRPSSSAVPLSAIAPQSTEWLPSSSSYKPATQPAERTPESTPMLLETEYARDLCPLPPLPASFLAGMAQKGKGKKRKIGQGEVEMSQLQAEFAVNPLSGALNRSSKCVLTADWKIAQQELRHLRVMKRVDEKQADGRWSLRQPKRHKGPVVPKAHWDWLLDEMEWLALDFKEELRWKQLLAYEFAHQIVEWHLSSADEKADMMVCERGWGPPSELGPERTAEEDIEMLVDDEKDITDVVLDSGTGLDPSGREVLEDMAVDDLDAEGEADAEGEPDADAEGEDEDLDADGEAEEEEVEVEDVGEGVIGLDDVDDADDAESEAGAESDKAGDDGSDHPDTRHVDELAHEASRRHPALNEAAAEDGRYSAEFLALCPARKEVLEADLETPLIDMTKLPLDEAHQEEPSFATLFPDLDIFQGPLEPVEGVINKRHDEGTAYAGRLTHTSRLMDVRPILVSSLLPSKNREHGQWLDLSDGPYFEEPKEPCVVKAEVVGTTTTFFSGKIVRPISTHPNHAPPNPLNHQQRAAATAWTDEEDEILKKLVDIYPYNWQLISDNFNSSKVTIPTDRRSAWDCYERWKVTWGPAKGTVVVPPAPAEATPAPAPPPTATAAVSTITPSTAPNTAMPHSIITNGLASAAASTSGQDTPVDGQNPPPPGLSKKEGRQAKSTKLEGSKKYVRHMVVYDAVRRTMRRRDQTKKAQPKDQANKVVVAHESHHQYLSNNVIWTPAELAEHKYQRDLRAVEQRNQRLLQDQQRMNLLRQSNQANQAGRQAAAAGRPAGAPTQPAQIAAMTAAAAVVAANRAAGTANGQQRLPPGVQNSTQLQQIQMLQAQQIAARQAQAQALAQQQAAQNGANGTPRAQPANIASSPFHAQGDLPAGAEALGSPQVGMHSSPQQQAAGMHRPPSVPLPAGHRGPGSASPQLNQAFPGGVAGSNASPNMHNGLLRLTPQQQQLLQQSLAATGQAVTPEALRAFQYSLQQQSAFQQAQVAQAQGQSPAPGAPQQFTRSPLAQTSQPAKASPKLNPQ